MHWFPTSFRYLFRRWGISSILIIGLGLSVSLFTSIQYISNQLNSKINDTVFIENGTFVQWLGPDLKPSQIEGLLNEPSVDLVIPIKKTALPSQNVTVIAVDMVPLLFKS